MSISPSARFTGRLTVFFIEALAFLSYLPVTFARPLIFSCAADNDLLRVALANRIELRRFDTPQAAVEAASDGDGVLLLADGYPAKTLSLEAALFAKALKLRVYVEYPSLGILGLEYGCGLGRLVH